MSSGKTANRLLQEKSPYLLQHAYNPVDWHPWGEEAFARARDEGKPIFLSVGYSTCYWCHVMEREVFEDPEIAALMNEHLINIKVDREERPDIDRIYMSAVQAITGSGGWPMSVFMTPEREPFYGGTYFPPTARHGRPGFPELVRHISELWKSDRAKVADSSRQITQFVLSHAQTDLTAEVDPSVPERTFERLRAAYDGVHAGFGSGPKFPRPAALNFLFRYWIASRNPEALEMTLETLRRMARGGMYDHLAGGFHRYSVDGEWRVPHFEKMLYDQAQLAVSYTEAYQITHDEFFARIVDETLDYVSTSLQHPEGGFSSAEDAESALDPARPDEKEEGMFYLWSTREITDLLGAENGAIFSHAYGVQEGGNALHDPMGVFIGRNILFASSTVAETAASFGRQPGEVDAILASGRSKLLRARAARPRPHLDDKVITAWNGLMISAFARAYQVFGKPKHRESAERAATFVLARLYDRGSKTLLRRYRDGEARFDAGLQDYAFLIAGLLDLYEAAFDTRWLGEAARLSDEQERTFWDRSAGGFFDTPGTDPTVLARTKDDYDGAEPTGNAVSALNFLRLGEMLDNSAWRDLGARTVRAFGARLNSMPDAAVQMAVALLWLRSAPREIILVGETGSRPTGAMLEAVFGPFAPHKVVLLVDEMRSRAFFAPHLPFIDGMAAGAGTTAAFLCESYACRLPTTDPEAVRAALDPHSEQPTGDAQ